MKSNRRRKREGSVRSRDKRQRFVNKRREDEHWLTVLDYKELTKLNGVNDGDEIEFINDNSTTILNSDKDQSEVLRVNCDTEVNCSMDTNQNDFGEKNPLQSNESVETPTTTTSEIVTSDKTNEAGTPEVLEEIQTTSCARTLAVNKTWEEQQTDRILIMSLYINKFDSPPTEEWDRKDGTVAKIKEYLPEVHRTTIKRILFEIDSTLRNGRVYCGLRKQRIFKSNYLIENGSYYQKLMCDLMEKGLGLSHVSLVVNKCLESDGKPTVGKSCIRASYRRLQPERIYFKRVSQGNYDAHSAWAKASFNLNKQLAICFGVLNPLLTKDPPMPPPQTLTISNPTNAIEENNELQRDEISRLDTTNSSTREGAGDQLELMESIRGDIPLIPNNENVIEEQEEESISQPVNPINASNISSRQNPVPESQNDSNTQNEEEQIEDMFNPEKLQKFEITQVAWWDETHKESDLKNMHGALGLDYVERTKRDKNGNPVVCETGIETEIVAIDMKVKYQTEGRFALGVAVIEKEDGVKEGVRINMFDYTNKTIICHADWTKKVKEEIDRVKNLQRGTKGWVQSSREDGNLYMNDDLGILKGIGKKVKERIEEYLQRRATVRDLVEIVQCEGRINDLVNAVSGMSKRKIEKIKKQLEDNVPIDGDIPEIKDYRQYDNPYLERYKDDWEKKIAESVTCNKHCSINHLIDHMFMETEKVFRNTKHSDDWMIYHDALSLFTAKESTDYMKTKGYIEHLILPQFDCNKGTVYANRMVGMRPEVMPLDCHLNQDLHLCVDRHVNMTSHLEDTNEDKFSRRTPKHTQSAYKRIWDPSLGSEAGAPLGKRIIEDVERVVNETYLRIFNNRGRALSDTEYKGRRAAIIRECRNEQGEGGLNNRRGGTRVKGSGELKHIWTHPTTESHFNAWLRECKRNFVPSEN